MPNPNSARCAQCNEVLTELRYVTDCTSYGWEAGTCSLEGDEWEYSDSEANDTNYDGDCCYECPFCGGDIGTIESWPDRPPQEEEEADAEPIKEEPTDTVNPDVEINNTRSSMVTIVTCPDCGFTRDADSGENTIICSRCDLEFPVTDNKKDY